MCFNPGPEFLYLSFLGGKRRLFTKSLAFQRAQVSCRKGAFSFFARHSCAVGLCQPDLDLMMDSIWGCGLEAEIPKQKRAWLGGGGGLPRGADVSVASWRNSSGPQKAEGLPVPRLEWRPGGIQGEGQSQLAGCEGGVGRGGCRKMSLKGPRDSARPWPGEGCGEIQVWGRHLAVRGEDNLQDDQRWWWKGPLTRKGRMPA